MINTLQKGIWILSSGSPIFLSFSITWFVCKHPVYISAVVFVITCVIIVSFFVLFKSIKSLSVLDINAKKVTQNDGYAIRYLISYLLPFASIAFDKYNQYILPSAAILIFIVMLIANTPTANPLLFFVGYHFYDVETENGIGNYLFISKRVIRNKNKLTKVRRISEYLLLDVREEL